MAAETQPALQLEDLHFRHPGLTAAAAAFYAEAAAVMLDGLHTSPVGFGAQLNDGDVGLQALAWRVPDPAVRRVVANLIDRIEQGAYSVALAVVETTLGQVCLRRAAHGDGADWLLVPVGGEESDDVELDLDRGDLVRLEVSGIASESDATMRRRLHEKVDQLRDAAVPGLAWAAVVGFGRPRVWLASMET